MLVVFVARAVVKRLHGFATLCRQCLSTLYRQYFAWSHVWLWDESALHTMQCFAVGCSRTAYVNVNVAPERPWFRGIAVACCDICLRWCFDAIQLIAACPVYAAVGLSWWCLNGGLAMLWLVTMCRVKRHQDSHAGVSFLPSSGVGCSVQFVSLGSFKGSACGMSDSLQNTLQRAVLIAAHVLVTCAQCALPAGGSMGV